LFVGFSNTKATVVIVVVDVVGAGLHLHAGGVAERRYIEDRLERNVIAAKHDICSVGSV